MTTRALTILLALAAVFGCVTESSRAGRGSEVENEVYGILVDVDGKPVPEAHMGAFPASSGVGTGSSATPLDSAVTNAQGRYSLRDLPAGSFDLYGRAPTGKEVVLIPGVKYPDPNKRLDLGTDTLRAPGSIRGRVLSGTQGKSAVLCYIPGTSYLAATDDSGRFAIANVPQGRYTVGYAAAGFATETDTGILVMAGKPTDVPPHQLKFDPALPPPAPEGLRAVVDTTNGRLTLSWHPVRVSDIQEYFVYRDEVNKLEPVFLGSTSDTAFVDVPQAKAGEAITVTYRVRSRDSGLALSYAYSAPLVVPGYRGFWSKASVALWGALPEISALPDGFRLAVKFHMPGEKNYYGAVLDRRVTVTWKHLEGDTLKSTVFNTADGMDTVTWIPREGFHRFEVRVRDAFSHMEAVEHFRFRFLPKGVKPVDAGRDTLVSVGDVVALVATVDSSFGPAIEWLWETNLDVFKQSALLITIPPGRDSIMCVARAQDTSALRASDTMVIRVKRPKGWEWTLTQSNPAFSPRVFPAWTEFQGRGWMVGGYRIEFSGDKVVPTLTGEIWSTADGAAWSKAADSAGFGTRVAYSITAFDDKIWVMGGQSTDGLIAYQDVWSSRDGITWLREADGLEGPRPNGQAFVFKDRLWFIGDTYFPLGKAGTSLPGGSWSSADGKAWIREATALPFRPQGRAVGIGGTAYALDWSGVLWTSADGKAWRKYPQSFPEIYANFGTELVGYKGDLLVFGRQGGRASLWRIPASDPAELIQDQFPFNAVSVHAAVLGGKLHILNEIQDSTALRNEIWTAP